MTMHMKSNRYLRSLSTLAVLGAGLVAGVAFAGPTISPPTVTVSYADLNLANPAGVRILHRRIKSAARAICGDDLNSQELELRDAARDCYKTAIRNAMEQVKTGENVAQN